MNSPEVKSPKKTYQTPQLRVHGNIREITQSAGGMGHLDGGTVLGHKRTM